MGTGLMSGMASWVDRRVTVVGLGIAGFACADALMQRGATVTIVDAADGAAQQERASVLSLIHI